MIQDIQRNDNLFYLKISGQITGKDVNYAVPIIEKAMKEHKNIKFLVVLSDFTGYTFGGFIQDFLFYFKYMHIFKYIAVVGNNDKYKKFIENFNKYFPCNARYFDESKLADAQDWINQI